MKVFQNLGLLFCISFLSINAFSQTYKGVFLENISWPEAEKLLTSETVVVIPLGAQSKEHGPHLPLSTDYMQSQFIANEIAKVEKVVIAPEINYGYYFPFISFPGSTSLRHSVAKNMIEDICRSLAAFGPKRFYVINEGITTNFVLKSAAEVLAGEGILLTYTDLIGSRVDALVNSIQQQKEGSHSDEIETSKLLYMRPEKVNMKFAKQEYGTRRGRGFPTRDSLQEGHYIPSGIYGDPTLATKEKGKKITEGMLKIIREDLDSLRNLLLPEPKQYDLEKYTGTYETADHKIITVSDQNGLLCDLNGFPKENLHYEGNDYFSGFYLEAWFTMNDAGTINEIRITNFNGEVIKAKKIK